MFKCYAITLCTVFITQQKISTPLSAKRYLCDICAFLNSMCNWDSFRFCVLACVMCVCVFLLFFVFLILLNQPPYLKFHKKIFTTNWSQIWMLFQDLIKYVLSFNTILTQFLEKWNKNYKKTKQKLFESLIELYSLCVS